jgi:hypothetical protein
VGADGDAMNQFLSAVIIAIAIIVFTTLLMLGMAGEQEDGEAKNHRVYCAPEYEIMPTMTRHGFFYVHKRNGVAYYYPREVRFM